MIMGILKEERIRTMIERRERIGNSKGAEDLGQ